MSLDAIVSKAADRVLEVAGKDATFLPASGDPEPARVFVERRADVRLDAFEGGRALEGVVLHYRRDTLSKDPAAGDAFQVGAALYTVQSIFVRDGHLGRLIVKEEA